MTTWTERTQQSETWTSEAPGRNVFSTLVFSHLIVGAKHVFAFGNTGVEFWDERSRQAETWTSSE